MISTVKITLVKSKEFESRAQKIPCKTVKQILSLDI